jgi:poly(A) polymerase
VNRLPSLRASLGPLLTGAGARKIWLVGGVLRDAFLGRDLADVDLAVAGDARKEAEALGRALGAKPFALDAERGIFRVVEKKGLLTRVFDFAALQGKTIQDDLRRRDFTLNALALPLAQAFGRDFHRHVLDLNQGRKDISQRRVRMNGPRVFPEDPLRLLRAFRLAAQLDFTVEPGTLAAVRRHRRLAAQSAAERVRDELYKVFCTPRAAQTLASMDRAGLLSVVFPEAEAMRKTAHAYYGKEGVLGHSIKAVASFEDLLTRLPFYFPKFHRGIRAYLEEPVAGYPRAALLKLAELLHDVGKPATAKVENGRLHFHGHDFMGMRLAQGIAGRFRLSHEETSSLSRLVEAHMRPGNLGHQPVLTDRAIYRFYRDLQGDALGMLLVALADHFTYLSEREKRSRKDRVFATIKKLIAAGFSRPNTVRPPQVVDGHDLMKAFELKPGPLIGRLLEAIREAQAAKKVVTRQDALAFVKGRLEAGFS